MSLEVNIPNDMFAVLGEAEIDKLFKESLSACAETLNRETKKSISAVSRSDLASKVKSTKPKRTKNGAYLLASYPMGKTRDGKRAGDAAFYMNYGTSRQPARPWVDNAKNNAEPECLEIIEKKHNEWLNKKSQEGWCGLL